MERDIPHVAVGIPGQRAKIGQRYLLIAVLQRDGADGDENGFCGNRNVNGQAHVSVHIIEVEKKRVAFGQRRQPRRRKSQRLHLIRACAEYRFENAGIHIVVLERAVRHGQLRHIRGEGFKSAVAVQRGEQRALSAQIEPHRLTFAVLFRREGKRVARPLEGDFHRISLIPFLFRFGARKELPARFQRNAVGRQNLEHGLFSRRADIRNIGVVALA